MSNEGCASHTLLSGFNHVHWQLDVFWGEVRDEHEVEEWLGRYDEGITRLVRDFGEALERGRVLGVVPFIPVLRTLISGHPVPHIRCGSGRDSFAIMTSGRIDACPIAPELPYSPVGDIRNSTPESLGHPPRRGALQPLPRQVGLRRQVPLRQQDHVLGGEVVPQGLRLDPPNDTRT